MRSKQRGVGLGGLMVGAFILIVGALLGMKLAPAYLEYATIKKTVQAIAQEAPGLSVAELRKRFDNRAQIDDITTVKGADLEIGKEGGQVVISVGYRREVPLFSNLGVYFDFVANSEAQ